MAFHSNIGGGKHSYIGLVASPNAYALITNTPFVYQVHPGNTTKPKLNDPILTVCQTLKNVVASEAEAEKGGCSSTDKQWSLSETPSSPWITRNQKMETPLSRTEKHALEYSTRL